jgi:hypothetical protein
MGGESLWETYQRWGTIQANSISILPGGFYMRAIAEAIPLHHSPLIGIRVC